MNQMPVSKKHTALLGCGRETAFDSISLLFMLFMVRAVVPRTRRIRRIG